MFCQVDTFQLPLLEAGRGKVGIENENILQPYVCIDCVDTITTTTTATTAEGSFSRLCRIEYPTQ